MNEELQTELPGTTEPATPAIEPVPPVKPSPSIQEYVKVISDHIDVVMAHLVLAAKFPYALATSTDHTQTQCNLLGYALAKLKELEETHGGTIEKQGN